MYTILVLGSGGREHTLCWKLKQSPLCKQIYIAPGNGGTQSIATTLDLDILDFDSIKSSISELNINMLVVGPELPLVEGIYDKLNDIPGLIIIGPSKKAAQLEGSKAFANKFMEQNGIPTAASKNIRAANLEEGIAYLRTKKPPFVLKADGLAAGKGVLILDDLAEAEKELSQMLSGKFGDASNTVVIEDFLDGIEFSVFVLTDGKDYFLLPEAKDYKRIGEGDQGLNTGGMGAISPVPFVDDSLMKKVKSRVIIPTIKGLQNEKLDYKGFIFIGLIKVNDEPYVIEYNCRLGDPETEVILPRLENDLVEVFASLYDGSLKKHTPTYSSDSVATVMLVSGGYPEAYKKGELIEIDPNLKDSLVFHAGTKYEDDRLLTNGGRVIALSSRASNFKDAVSVSLKNCEKVKFNNKYFRSDIGFDL